VKGVVVLPRCTELKKSHLSVLDKTVLLSTTLCLATTAISLFVRLPFGSPLWFSLLWLVSLVGWLLLAAGMQRSYAATVIGSVLSWALYARDVADFAKASPQELMQVAADWSLAAVIVVYLPLSCLFITTLLICVKPFVMRPDTDDYLRSGGSTGLKVHSQIPDSENIQALRGKLDD
jgi:hypothetical protein